MTHRRGSLLGQRFRMALLAEDGMDELEAAGLLETSTGLAVLAALFLLAAFHSWWSERRARKARRARLLAALEEGPRETATPVAEAPPDPGASASEEAEPSGPPLEVDEASGEAPQLPPEGPALSQQDGAVAVVDQLGLSDDDAEEIVAEADETRTPEAESPVETAAPVDVEQLQRLDHLIERREFGAARELLAELAGSFPQDHSLRCRAGRLALRCGRPQAAVRLLERCLERDPHDLDSRLELCAAHAELQGFEDVVRHARRGLELLPQEGRLLVHLSEAAFELGAPDEALELAGDALRARPKPESFFHLSRLLAMSRRLASNDSDRLRQALDRYPGEPALLHAAGVFEAMYGSPAAALRILRSAAEKEPVARHRRAIEREIAALDSSQSAA